MTAKTDGFVFVVNSFDLDELKRKLDSEEDEAFPIVLSPEDNPVEASTFECVFDKDYLEKAFSYISRLSVRVSVKRLNIVE